MVVIMKQAFFPPPTGSVLQYVGPSTQAHIIYPGSGPVVREKYYKISQDYNKTLFLPHF